jgi:outer membrane protein assembly factor BamB
LTWSFLSAGGVFGGVAHDGNVVLVLCSGELRALAINDSAFSMVWSAPARASGPPIIAGSLVWLPDQGTDAIIALDRSTGREVFNEPVGLVTRFGAPAAAGQLVFAAAGGDVMAYGN